MGDAYGKDEFKLTGAREKKSEQLKPYLICEKTSSLFARSPLYSNL